MTVVLPCGCQVEVDHIQGDRMVRCAGSRLPDNGVAHCRGRVWVVGVQRTVAYTVREMA